MTMRTNVSLEHRKRMLEHLKQQEIIAMAIEAVEVGTVLYDNDPRHLPGRKLIVTATDSTYAFCTGSADRHQTRIRLDRIYTDGKPRRRGFSTTPPAAPVRIPISGGEDRVP